MSVEDVYDEYAVIVDTNVLLDKPYINHLDWGISPIHVLILEPVLEKELRGLQGHEDEETAEQARVAFEHLSSIRRRTTAEGYRLPDGGRLHFVPAPAQIEPPLDPESVDHQQIAFAQTWQTEKLGRFCALITRDQDMATAARVMEPRVHVVRPPFTDVERRIQERLRSLVMWTGKIEQLQPITKEAVSSITGARNVPQIRKEKKRQERPEPEQLIQQRVKNLYGRIRSAHHRAVLAIAPQEMRLALSADIIEKLTASKKRVVLLFLPDRGAVDWWSGELHRRTDLPAGSICVFGRDAAPTVAKTRVVLYRHDQIERRVDHHVTRFNHAGRRTTAIADGCERLNPVAIAMLLFDCDQFIGFTQHPFDHVQAPGGRMIQAFFQQQTIATYTFADADRDGWLHPFDFYARGIDLSTEEQEKYDRLREEMISQHNTVRRRYRVDHIWEGLPQLLVEHVDEDAASLYQIREQLENIAQDALGKPAQVEQLLGSTGQPARCILLDSDYEQWWTSMLKNYLPQQGYEVAVAHDENWEPVWRRFERAEIDCLITHDAPPPDLVPAVIRRLILPTPLAPLSLLSRMTDWTLSHAVSGPPVSVDLLYTRNTPDQEAMIAFAEANFGLRFT